MNVRFRQRLRQAAELDTYFARDLLDICRNDVLFWTNLFLWLHEPRVMHEDAEGDAPNEIPWITYECQDEMILDLYASYGRSDRQIEKSRDMGATYCCLNPILHKFQFGPSSTMASLLSRTEAYVDAPDDPKSLFWKLDFMLAHQPDFLLPRLKRKYMLYKNLDNGATIVGESTTENALSGARPTVALFDEFSKVPNGRAMLEASRDATKCRWFNSTPKGANNGFAEMARNKSVKKHTMHWSRHPLKAKGLYTKFGGNYVWLDKEYWARRPNPDAEMEAMDQRILAKQVPLPDGKFRSPFYANECERAGHPAEIAQELDIDYQGHDYPFFDAVLLEKAKQWVRPPTLVGELIYDPETCEPIGFSSAAHGRLKLWHPLGADGKLPNDTGYVVGCDISQGTGASNSALSAGMKKTGEKVAEFVDPNIDAYTFAKYAVAISKWLTNASGEGALLIWESNGPGRMFSKQVIQTKYPHIYLERKKLNALAETVSDTPGFWNANGEVKLNLLGEYRQALGAGIFVNRSLDAIEECRQYVFRNGEPVHVSSAETENMSGARESHGDIVIADSVMWRGMRDAIRGRNQRPAPNEIHPHSFAGRRQRYNREQQAKTRYW